ncbi:hypothetical protein [Hymenobacter canadensis]|uniref:Uncharacterized protein n=1 Tax=Hymenobacter canadensis TaxID=2999067 RepID=A0ABY7LSH3_9BACT|nr:hypothetical protein [Hymenobacter canadensis]WBA42145.1 hypothetical protein O3303_00995 [Hymenobacter canadensis]
MMISKKDKSVVANGLARKQGKMTETSVLPCRDSIYLAWQLRADRRLLLILEQAFLPGKVTFVPAYHKTPRRPLSTMLQVTSFLFHCLYSLVAKRQLYPSGRLDAAKVGLVMVYALVGFDLLLVIEKIMNVRLIQGQLTFLLLAGLLLGAYACLQTRYFKRHLTEERLSRYDAENGRARVWYALVAVWVLAVVYALPFTGFLAH